jgi:hypothetical protein
MTSRAETPLAGEFAIVDQVVRQHAPDLAVLGFDFSGVTLENSPPLQGYAIFHFLNKHTGMTIEISFFRAREGRNGGFTVLIVSPGNRKLSIKEYLRLHGFEDLTKRFIYRDPSTDVRDFADSFLQMLVELLHKDLRPIIEGKAWEETPIDWMGYK